MTKKVTTKAVKVKKVEEKAKQEFAVIQVTGNQYLVELGKEYTVKNLNLEKGKEFSCDKVLLLVQDEKVQIGKPYLEKVIVECEISGVKKGEKIDSFRYTAKSRYRKSTGSRALLTKILVKKFVTKS